MPRWADQAWRAVSRVVTASLQARLGTATTTKRHQEDELELVRRLRSHLSEWG